jgi:energy-coupling factor transporter transmembrane protein EcfT
MYQTLKATEVIFMETIAVFFTENPVFFKVMIIIVLIVVAYFIFKQFLNLSLVLLLILLAGAGYHYYNNPQKMSEDVQKLKSGVEKGKSFYKDSKELIHKTAKVPGDINRLLKGEEDQTGK